MATRKRLNFAMPSTRPHSVFLKDAKGQVIFELEAIVDGFTVRAQPRAESTALAISPNAGNSITILAKDIT